MPRDEAPPRLDVIGIGSMVADRMHRVRRIIGPEEKTVLSPLPEGPAEATYVGGLMLNQLGWAALLGARTGVFGKQADDPDGRMLRAAMDRSGIERHLVLDGSQSSLAQIFVDDEGGRAIYMAPAATAETDAAHVRERHGDFIARADRVSTEISQLPLDAVLETLRLADAAGAETILDVDVPPSEAVPTLGDRETLEAVLQAAHVLKPAKSAAREIVPEAGDSALDVARALRERYGSRAVIVTDGEIGCAIVTADGGADGHDVPGIRGAKVLDTTGAGDAFLGGFLAGRAQGLEWVDAARLGHAAGAACVEKIGAFPDDAATLRARIAELYEGPPVAGLSAPTEAPDDSVTGSAGAGEALASIDVTLEELAALRARLDAERFERALELVRATEREGARVHATGVGKPEHVARYVAGVLSSTGTPTTFLHATEAIHGSAGQVRAGDLVIAISNSGETAELLAAVGAVRGLGARILAVTGGLDSSLAREADAVLDAGAAREGGGLGFAPRASVAAEVVVLAALSAALETERGFTRAEYHARHPAGALGKRSGG